MADKTQLLQLEETLKEAVGQTSFDAQLLTSRSMFGGIGVYYDGRYFCSISNIGLALKFSDEMQNQLLTAEPDAKHLQYDPDSPPSKQYIVLPSAIVSDPARLIPWVEKSIVYVMTLPVKKKK